MITTFDTDTLSVQKFRQDGNIVSAYDAKYKFFETFDMSNGTHVIGDRIDTGEDPFMRSLPSLIDCGVMGNCAHSHLCPVGCYQGGTGNQKPNMTFEDFKSIIDQVKSYVFQVALGGHGDPNQHPDFEKIVAYARSNGVVPNYTTSGYKLSTEAVRATREHCGAAAVSHYGQKYTDDAIAAFMDAGCVTNIHYVLSNKSIEYATKALGAGWFPDVNAIIFLLHKPVGKGKADDVLGPDSPWLAEFFRVVQEQSRYKIGFDSCSIQGVMKYTDKFDLNSMDTCEGARFSCYISASGQISPCSFDQDFVWGVSLRDYTVAEAWESDEFKDFRDMLAHGTQECSGCKFSRRCTGPCPIKPEITLCHLKGDR